MKLVFAKLNHTVQICYC